jgi:MFS family permease
VFQTQYISQADTIIPTSEKQNRALIAFIGTLAAGLTWSGSIFVNPLMSRVKSLKTLTMTGAVLMATGYFLASFATRTWHLLLTQGLIEGIGSSLLYFPILSIAPEYFSARRGAAMGFILSGAGTGGLVLSPVTSALISQVGTRWTLRSLALINLCIGMAVALATSPTRSSITRPTLVNVRIATKPAFILQALAALLQASGNFVPLTFLPEFSISLGYTAATGALLLAVSNGVNSVARITTGAMADMVGRQNTLIVSLIASALSVSCVWITAATGEVKGLWITFVVLYGFTAGGFNALFPTTITDIFGIQAYASVNGFVYFVRGLGALFGSPVAGLLLGNKGSVGNNTLQLPAKDFTGMIWYDAALLLASSICVVGVRGFDALDKRDWKWKA